MSVTDTGPRPSPGKREGDGLHLIRHPAFPSVAVTAIRVDATRRERGELVLRYHVEGDLDAVAWPPLDGPAERTDELWKHSCFEAFVGFVDEPGYCEFNFAAGAWAAYQFDGYRENMRDIDGVQPFGHWVPGLGTAVWHVRIPLLDQPRDWRLGLSVIIEAKDGSKSFWALSHPSPEPDFHNADCFIASLPAPAAA